VRGVPGNRYPYRDSGNVYENKGQNDNLPDPKDDICAWLHVILHKNTRIFQKPSTILRLFERWGTNLSLQNVETRDCGPKEKE
jgi:hypothetical protein